MLSFFQRKPTNKDLLFTGCMLWYLRLMVQTLVKTGDQSENFIFAVMFAGSLKVMSRKNKKQLWCRNNQLNWNSSHLRTQALMRWTPRTCYSLKSSSYHKRKLSQSHQVAKIWSDLNDQDVRWKNLAMKKKIMYPLLLYPAKDDPQNQQVMSISHMSGLLKHLKRPN